MKFPKRASYLLLLLLLTLSLFLRSVYTPQHGGDTWCTYIRAQTISKNGAATWVLNPFSYIGLYPYSYPTGEAILLSAVNTLTTLDMGTTVYVSSIFFGITGIFGVYLLARAIWQDYVFVLISTFTFATFFFPINYSWNNVSTRGLFIFLYPYTLYLALMAYKYQRDLNIYH